MLIKINQVNVLLCIGMLASFFASVWQGRYSVDPHHWGLMLSNAKDFYDGKAPYKDIFIQYGFGTTLIQSFGFAINPSLISVLAITAAFYSIALGLIYKISYIATQNQRLSIYIFIVCSLIHPIIIYPWANYIAFPFIVFGIYCLLSGSSSYAKTLLGGISFGLAILGREGVAISLIFIAGTYFIYDIYFTKNIIKNIKLLLLLLIGICTPLLLFISYLWMNDLLNYWIIYSWDLPNIYLKLFPHMTGVHVFGRLVGSIWLGVKAFNVTWLLIASSLLCCVFALITMLRQGKSINAKTDKIAIAALALLAGALHLTEIFRIATGSIIGIVVLFYLLNKIKMDSIIFYIVIFLLAFNFTNPVSGNYSFPKTEVREKAVVVTDPAIFKNQKWLPEINNYYASISHDIERLQSLDCGLKFHVNNTMDTFLHVLSPFKNYSITPYVTTDELLPIRPDIPLIKDKFKDNDVVFFQMVPFWETDLFVGPSDYFLYKIYETPQMPYIPIQQVLEIFIPNMCKHKLDTSY
jgi:hypothetical protein